MIHLNFRINSKQLKEMSGMKKTVVNAFEIENFKLKGQIETKGKPIFELFYAKVCIILTQNTCVKLFF